MKEDKTDLIDRNDNTKSNMMDGMDNMKVELIDRKKKRI
jgi:hypothetical protein